MIPSEIILFNLKRSVLEHCLKYQIDPIVDSKYFNFCFYQLLEQLNLFLDHKVIAFDSKTDFNSYNIHKIYFELYNLHIVVKNQELDQFEKVVQFLIEFNDVFPDIIEQKLLKRVMTSLKVLVTHSFLFYQYSYSK
jgi:hypothetical protein